MRFTSDVLGVRAASPGKENAVSNLFNRVKELTPTVLLTIKPVLFWFDKVLDPLTQPTVLECSLNRIIQTRTNLERVYLGANFFYCSRSITSWDIRQSWQLSKQSHSDVGVHWINTSRTNPNQNLHDSKKNMWLFVWCAKTKPHQTCESVWTGTGTSVSTLRTCGPPNS